MRSPTPSIIRINITPPTTAPAIATLLAEPFADAPEGVLLRCWLAEGNPAEPAVVVDNGSPVATSFIPVVENDDNSLLGVGSTMLFTPEGWVDVAEMEDSTLPLLDTVVAWVTDDALADWIVGSTVEEAVTVEEGTEVALACETEDCKSTTADEDVAALLVTADEDAAALLVTAADEVGVGELLADDEGESGGL